MPLTPGAPVCNDEIGAFRCSTLITCCPSRASMTDVRHPHADHSLEDLTHCITIVSDDLMKTLPLLVRAEFALKNGNAFRRDQSRSCSKLDGWIADQCLLFSWLVRISLATDLDTGIGCS